MKFSKLREMEKLSKGYPLKMGQYVAAKREYDETVAVMFTKDLRSNSSAAQMRDTLRTRKPMQPKPETLTTLPAQLFCAIATKLTRKIRQHIRIYVRQRTACVISCREARR